MRKVIVRTKSIMYGQVITQILAYVNIDVSSMDNATSQPKIKYLDRIMICRMGYTEDVEIKTSLHKRVRREGDDDGENVPPPTSAEPSSSITSSNALDINAKLKVIMSTLDENSEQLDVLAEHFDNFD
ncbi:Uncharacterized protein TCM_019560 [Theobroma cacao]|uniref:Uncharacterized protein n=1 Tax=Theobroma cacao TaxID=3641 RepID=A0A061EPQ7_THECC|nr:Uncharacterized protein TCM_019560 [Theobroma cacao]